MRPWLGFTVMDIATLPPDTYELMPESSVDSTVVVKEVMVTSSQILVLCVK